MSRKQNSKVSKGKFSRSEKSTREKKVQIRTSGNPNATRYEATKSDKADEHLEQRPGNPNWYYSDERLADQVSQLSFQSIAGYPLRYDNTDFSVPNIVRVHMLPAPGVQLSRTYGSHLMQSSGINLAGFRLFSKLSAYTGRVAAYGPQDVSTMILAFGEIISIAEYIRRAFGVAYTMNMRNRDYPKQILEFGMRIDADDFFTNLSNYRTKFNTLLTLINQLPIPKGIAYFDKCAALYERLFLDHPSSMAQTLVTVPHWTWTLDEQSYSGGSILKTTNWMSMGMSTINDRYYSKRVADPMSTYLNTFESMISAVLNSSSLQVVYTDLLNLASKTNVEFWKMDFLYEDYRVIPEFDQEFMLQMHNSTIASVPGVETALVTGTNNVTPLNDVYPDPNTNSLYYNPAFPNMGATVQGMPPTGKSVVIDMFDDNPSLSDRVEVTRYASISGTKLYQYTGATGTISRIDAVLPDHFICSVDVSDTTGAAYSTRQYLANTLVPDTGYKYIASSFSNIDWSPRIFEVNLSTNAYTGNHSGDLNFYTVVDEDYLRKLHDFVGLALYDMR